MDWSKVDGRLAVALSEEGPSSSFAVFVHLDPEADLDDLLISAVGAGEDPVRTAMLTPDQVDALSEHPQVRHLRMSTSLRTTGEP